MSYPQSKPNAFDDSFAQVAPKDTGPLHYEGVDVTDGKQMRDDAPQGAFSLNPGTEEDRMPKSKLETATGTKLNTPQLEATDFPFPTGF